MKTCNKCCREVPLTDFYRAAGMRDGHRNDCKACNLAAKADRYRADPKRAIERVEEWRKKNADHFRRYQRDRRTRPEVKARERDGHLRRKFGITLETYEAMLSEQGGRCAICRRPPTEGISLHVDHEHGTNRVRGLLCFKCNNALGDFDDDPALLRAALTFLGATPSSAHRSRGPRTHRRQGPPVTVGS